MSGLGSSLHSAGIRSVVGANGVAVLIPQVATNGMHAAPNTCLLIFPPTTPTTSRVLLVLEKKAAAAPSSVEDGLSSVVDLTIKVDCDHDDERRLEEKSYVVRSCRRSPVG